MTTQNRELASLIDSSGNVTATGNLTVSGTTTAVSSTNTTVTDPLIELNNGAGSNSNDLGFVFERGSTGNNACLIWDESNDAFAVGTTTATGTSTGNMSYTTGDFLAGKITVDNVIINGTTIGHTDDTDLITFADGALTVAGTIASTGVVTANAGVVVDNITIDGTEIDLSSGDLTLDVAGDIILDADGSTISMKDGGTTRITFNLDATPDLVLAGGNASITASTSNADLSFIGNDGGSDITALTFDMSEAGKAIFNQGLVAGTSTAGDWGLILNTAAGDSVKLQVADTGTGSAADATLSVSDGDLILSPSTNLVGVGTTAPENVIHLKGTNNSAGDLGTEVGPGNIPAIVVQNAGTTDNNLAGLFFMDDASIRAGVHARFTDHSANSAELRFSTSSSGTPLERMKITASGNVVIGASTSNIDVGIGNTGTVGHLGRTGSGALIHLGGDDCQVRLANSILHHDNSGNTNLYLRNHYTTLGSDNNAKLTLEAGTIVFATSTAYTERVRVASNGAVHIGTGSGEANGSTGGASFSADSSDRRNLICATTSSGNLELVEFRNPNGTVGDIKSNGTSTSYNTSSDYRLKENVNYTWDATTRLKQLKPARFNFKTDTDTTLDGFLAHEVSSIVPLAVSGEKDGEKMQSIDHSKLVPLLVKTIQELEARVATLES